MGRNRTPTEILSTRGSFLAHPSRKRPNEPDGGKPLGGPPKHLGEIETELWKEIKRDLLPGVAKKSDRHSFETLVILKARERSGLILAADRGQLISLYSHFGLTPASRSKVSVPAAPRNSLQDFLSKKVAAPAASATPDTPEDLNKSLAVN
jgi:phage terminase small subunit